MCAILCILQQTQNVSKFYYTLDYVTINKLKIDNTEIDSVRNGEWLSCKVRIVFTLCTHTINGCDIIYIGY